MESNELPSPPTNKHSVISLVLGILTILALCGGMAPIPFTGFICFPTTFILGLLALIYGAISLNVIRKNNESGKPLAWMGILSGGFIFMCMLCMLIAIVSLFIFAPDSVPPIIDGYQI